MKGIYARKMTISIFLLIFMAFFVYSTVSVSCRIFSYDTNENPLSFSFEDRINIRQRVFDDESFSFAAMAPCIFDKIAAYIFLLSSCYHLAYIFIPTLSLLLVVLWNQNKDGKKKVIEFSKIHQNGRYILEQI